MQAGKRAVTLQTGLCASYPLLHSDYDYDYILFIRIRYIFREVDHLLCISPPANGIKRANNRK